MKKICLFIALSVFIISFLSCHTNNNGFGNFKTNSEAADRIRKGKVEIETIIIDSCEYLFTSQLPWDGNFSLTHKGNCKFCYKKLAEIISNPYNKLQ